MESLRQQVEKRITGIEYIKRSHMGGAYWFNVSSLRAPHLCAELTSLQTIQLTQDDLNKLFEPQKMRPRCAPLHSALLAELTPLVRRTTRFAVLGMSLSALLDIPAPHDFLRGLLSLVQEYEGVPDDKFERKNVSCAELVERCTANRPDYSNEDSSAWRQKRARVILEGLTSQWACRNQATPLT